MCWTMAALPHPWKWVALAYLFGIRLLIIYVFDSKAFQRPMVNNVVGSVSLTVSDSAWQKDEVSLLYYAILFDAVFQLTDPTH